MSRCHFRWTINLGTNGKAIQNALVRLYLPDTTTPVTDAWSAPTAGTSVTTLISNNQSEVECWFDTPQEVDVLVTDNSHLAYYTVDASTKVTFADFTERVSVLPPASSFVGIAVNAAMLGCSSAAAAATNTTAISDAIALLPAGGGKVVVPPGIVNHNGITAVAGLELDSAGVTTTLNNTGTGPNITVPTNANSVVLGRGVTLTGVSGSTHGVHVIDSLWFQSYAKYHSWGQNSAAIRLDTVANPSGNGAYWAEIWAPEINADLRTGCIGIHCTGTAAGANRARVYGGSIRNCAKGIRVSFGSGITVFTTEVSGCTLGVGLDGGANVDNCEFLFLPLESNTEHCNVGAGCADNKFIFCTYADPSSFGTDSGTRTSRPDSTDFLFSGALTAAQNTVNAVGLTSAGRVAASGTGTNQSLPITSKGTGALQFNVHAGTGTGGTQFGDGAGNVVASFQSDGVINTTSYILGQEIVGPAAPAANQAILFFRDNGSGKTQLAVQFASGAVQVVATQP